jgi:hypothetical protein
VKIPLNPLLSKGEDLGLVPLFDKEGLGEIFPTNKERKISEGKEKGPSLSI